MKLLIAVFMCVVVPFVFAVEDSPRPTPSIEETKLKIEEAQLDKAKPGENQPVVGAVEVKPVAGQHDADYKTDNEKTDPHKPVDYQWWFNLFLVILTGGLVVTGALQVRVYREQARYMREGLEVTRQSVKAGQDSANAAMKSAEVAERALKVTERADVVIRGWQFYSSPTGTKDDAEDRIIFYRFNSGRTRATMISAYGAVALVSHTSRTPLSFPNYKEELTEEIRGVVISPQGTHTALMDPLTADQREARDQGTRRIYAFGYLLYEDVFGDRHEVASLGLYDANMGRFVVAESPEYNYSRPIEKENQ